MLVTLTWVMMTLWLGVYVLWQMPQLQPVIIPVNDQQAARRVSR